MSDFKSGPGNASPGKPAPRRSSSDAPAADGPRRRPSPPNALDALLAEPAGDPLRRALWLDGLDRRLRPLLPPALAAHARLANYERGRLVVLVDAPVWRARLRLAAPELLDAARSIGLAATELVVKTRPGPPAPPPAAPRKTVPISAAAQQALQSALASLRDPQPVPRHGRPASSDDASSPPDQDADGNPS